MVGVYFTNGTGGYDVIEELLYLDNFREAATVRPDATLGMAAPQIFPVLTNHLGSPRTIVDQAGAPPRRKRSARHRSVSEGMVMDRI